MTITPSLLRRRRRCMAERASLARRALRAQRFGWLSARPAARWSSSRSSSWRRSRRRHTRRTSKCYSRCARRRGAGVGARRGTGRRMRSARVVVAHPSRAASQSREALPLGVRLVGEGGQDVEGAGYGRSQVPQAQEDGRGALRAPTAAAPPQPPPPAAATPAATLPRSRARRSRARRMHACAQPAAARVGGRCAA